VPTDDRRQALSRDEARARAGLIAFPERGGGPHLDRIGLEPEFFPIRRDRDGRPAGRLPLRGDSTPGVLGIVDELACSTREVGSRQGGPVGPWEYPLLRGDGRLTFEPGGQVEHSTTAYPTVREALDGGRRVLGLLRHAFAAHDVVLAAAGIDVWHDIETVPQQLPFGRYTAQATYYDRRGTAGRIMMRHTASLQINLDLGPEGVWQERWLAANLISPLITASFACSPGDGWASSRGRAWQELDPSRSGFPKLLFAGDIDDPREQWAEAALAADVMLFRGPEGVWDPGSPGFSFGQWLADGHPRHGWPTRADLDYHLSTLFFEVRPRGFLELRAGEQLPDCWRAAQVVLTSSAVYDDVARRAIVERMAPHTARLPELWRRAAEHGVADAELRELAAATWHDAVRGAERLPGGWVGADGLACARRFLDQVTGRGLTPADRLRELHTEDPARSLAWAASQPPTG
jgi:glutamate--cysteine ligase